MSSDGPKYKILDAPPADDAPGPRLAEVVSEDEAVDEYVIEDLESADSPVGGVRCHHCYCTG